MSEDRASPASALTFDITDEAATCRLAQDVAACLQTGDLVTLAGGLGAGKTTFARALIRAAAGDPVLEVPSPTFPIRVDYQMAHLDLVHVDLYRIGGDDDASELGLEDGLEDATLVVEWPDRIAWPQHDNRLDIAIRQSGDQRQADLEVSGDLGARLRRSFAIRTFLGRSGFADAGRLHVIGDASAKAFERIAGTDGRSAILMNAPARPPGPDLPSDIWPAQWRNRSYDDVAHRALDVLPFLAIAKSLAGAGVHAPEILAHDRDAGFVLMEDLGAETTIDNAGNPIAERYRTAIDLLARMHAGQWPRTLRFDGETWDIPDYDNDALLIEIALYSDWYVPHVRGAPFTPQQRRAFLQQWQSVLQAVGHDRGTWVMRDFHSPNILWQPDADGLDRIGVIDVQDTLIGHPAYDVVSLAQDARVTISEEMEAELIQRYCAARRVDAPAFDDDAFATACAIFGAQRATKVLGAFTRLAFHAGKPGYQAYLERVKTVLARNLRHPVLSGLHVWYAGLID